MHGAGRVGGYKFQQYLAAIPRARCSEVRPFGFDVPYALLPECGREGDVQETGARYFGGNFSMHAGSKFGGKFIRQLARRHSSLLRQHHGEVGGQISMFCILGMFQDCLGRPFPAEVSDDGMKFVL